MKKTLSILVCCFLLSVSTAFAGHYTAYSLKAAQSRLSAGSSENNVIHMGGITHPIAAIYDKDTDDVILVGKIVDNHSPVSLDDWAVAVNAVLKIKRDPAVSIDRTNETEKTNKQKVRFEGGLENTQFGKDLLAADVILKRLGLNTLTANIFNVSSYLDLSIKDFEKTGKQNPVVSRFWFLPDTEHAKVTVQDGLIIAEEYRILVKNEIMSTEDDDALDLPAEIFARDLYTNFQDIKLYYPELSRMEQLYYIAAIAQGLKSSGMAISSAISYWLNDFPVKKNDTLKEYPVEKNSAKAIFQDKELTIVVSGGIDLDVMVYRLQSGGIEAIKNYIIKSRPNANSLSWEVPLLTSVLDTNYDSLKIEAIKKSESKKPGLSTNIMRGYMHNTSVSTPLPTYSFKISNRPLSSQLHSIKFNNQLSHTRYTHASNVGGVMLENVADVTGDEAAGPLDMAGAKFSFIVDGEDARLDPQTFRKFITALWAVYYSNEDPGISIDPIAPGAEKHMVRYIGQVINTDLGRVMREADYLMKKWAVGTETPDIKGFKSPMDYAAESGMLSIGAWSRFWFVPKDMQFRRSDNMLLFEGGKMTVQTEYMYQGFGSGADPANQKFAKFFTEHYDEIAKKYPVYQELYDYAKMVSLAKYLKESGIPLFWFLMANKDLVITEDSISTVDALIKNSRQFVDVYIEGGVELCSKGQYIYDNEAIGAINDALAMLPSRPSGSSSSGTDKVSDNVVGVPFSFTLKERSLSVLPQHSPSSGKDFRGMRYQTDFTVKEAGYQLNNKSFARLQYEMFRLKYAELLYNASDSKGNLPAGEAELIVEESWKKAESVSARIVGNLKSLLNKDFKSEARFQKDLSEYMPKSEFDLWKNLITQHAFYNTTLELVRCFHLDDTRKGIFGLGWDLMVPYQIRPHGEETVEFQGLIMPGKIALIDKLSGREEVLTFDSEKFRAAAYIPDDIKKSQVVGLFMMTDGSYRMLDKIENEFEFNGAGFLTDMIFSDIHQIHFDYQKDFAAKLDNSPYKIERASDKWIKFRTIRLPEKLRIRNLASGSSEIVVFTKEKSIAGYESADPERSDFEFLALMTDLSYRLVDKNKNELLFSQSGQFQEMVCTSKEYLVKSMSSGNYDIEFGYSLNKKGEPVIIQASLLKEGESDKAITLSYEYGIDGHLASVLPPDGKVF